MSHFSKSLLLLSTLGTLLRAGATSVMLQATPGQVTFGASLTLTATVTPSAATGKVTFYDGGVVLGTSVVSGGVATRTVHLYSTGKRSLLARYIGDAGNTRSTSATVAVTVNSIPAAGFTSSTIDMGVSLLAVTVTDLNGDGKADLVGVGTANSVKAVLGDGNGSFSVPVSTLLGGSGPFASLAIADFDGDGKADVLVSSPVDNTIRLRERGRNFQQSSDIVRRLGRDRDWRLQPGRHSGHRCVEQFFRRDSDLVGKWRPYFPPRGGLPGRG